MELTQLLSFGLSLILQDSVNWVNFRGPSESGLVAKCWTMSSWLRRGWVSIKAKTVNQSWRVRLLRVVLVALFANVVHPGPPGPFLACFPFGPGLREYGASLSQGFQMHSAGI